MALARDKTARHRGGGGGSGVAAKPCLTAHTRPACVVRRMGLCAAYQSQRTAFSGISACGAMLPSL